MGGALCVTDRQKLSGAREEVIEEQQAQVLEDVPLTAVHAVTITPRQPHFKYILHCTTHTDWLSISVLSDPWGLG